MSPKGFISGVSSKLRHALIKKIIIDDMVKPEQKAEALVEAATHANSHSQDNTSVAMIIYEEKDIKKI